jgi:hypothetical protein
MYQWLQALISGAVIALPHVLSPTTQTHHGLLPKEALEWTESMRIKYNLPGISIGVIASPERTGEGWKNETHGLGYMDTEGKSIDGDVSDVHFLQWAPAESTRRCLQLRRTQSSSLLCQSVS